MKKTLVAIFYVLTGAYIGYYICKYLESKKRSIDIPISHENDLDYDDEIAAELDEEYYKEIPNDYANIAMSIISHLEDNTICESEIHRYEHICNNLGLDKLTPLGKTYVMNIVIKESTRGFFFVNYCVDRWNNLSEEIIEIRTNNDRYMKTKWKIENEDGTYKFMKETNSLFTVNIEEEDF